MIEYVFRQSRREGGKRVLSRLYYGRYSVTRGAKPVTVALSTPDKAVAAKRLRDIVVNAQKESEGMIPSSARREGSALPLVVLLADYRNDLAGRGLKTNHVKETVARIQKLVGAAGWSKLSEITPASYVAVRAGLQGAAKTRKEYQTSLVAFLNWCVRMDRLEKNPLARVDRVEIRGKAVRKSRAFTQAEFSALLQAAPPSRRLVYQFLAYTGARKNEAASLRWDHLNLGENPSVLFAASNTKSGVKRSLPLKRELAEALSLLFRSGVWEWEGAFVFAPFPSDDALHADLARAGIPRRDASGRVVHFHAFRKTFQTWGAVAGIGQRSAQEMLGHSDPALTSEVYTDVAALELHREVSKLPWIDAHTGAHTETGRRVCVPVSVRKIGDIIAELVEAAKSLSPSGDTQETDVVSMAARHGFEPGKLGLGFYKNTQRRTQALQVLAALWLGSAFGQLRAVDPEGDEATSTKCGEGDRASAAKPSFNALGGAS